MMRIACCLGLIVALLVLPPNASAAYTREEAALLSCQAQGNVVRLHILADSDTPQAQAIKLRVRDSVLGVCQARLRAESADELYEMLAEQLDLMQRVAEKTARRCGFTGDVRAEIGCLTLPAKRYGSVFLPTGDYRALRITLGQGEGHNWWCILFPSLCLAAASDDPWQTELRFKDIPLTSDLSQILLRWTAIQPNA